MSLFDAIKKAITKRKSRKPVSLTDNVDKTIPSAKTPSFAPQDQNTLSTEHKEKLAQALQLGQAGSSREAMKLVLGVMEAGNINDEVINLAGTILYTGYNELDWLLKNDYLLDSLFSQCDQCNVFWPINPMYKFAKSVHISNPVGAICTECSKVYCRECAKNISGVLFCPIHGIGLSPITSPTGRKRYVAERSSQKKLAHVIIVRNYPEPPRIPGYIRIMLESTCSAALTDQPLITFQMSHQKLDASNITVFLIVEQKMSNWPDYLDEKKYEVTFGNHTDPDGGEATVICVYFA